MTKTLLFQTPRSVTSLGKEIFIKLPLYKLKYPVQPIYINKPLLKRILQFNGNATWPNLCELVKKNLSCTLAPERGTGEHCGWAYVDKQADPLDIALLGNEGSGRAYYAGRYFNIKGEKTPLATSEFESHADGILSMTDGIWSALVANSLYDEFENRLAPVLTLLLVKEPEAVRMLLVRVDWDGALNRITHVFCKQQPLSKRQLRSAAGALGKLEGEKFIHRVVHGSWSSGNTSLQGHLIDYDSICAVKGRQPQFSKSANYPDNYFGFEYEGQIKILNSLAASAHINHEQVDFAQLEETLLKSMQQTISQKLVYLMGFVNDSEIYCAYKRQIDELGVFFSHLAQYTRFKSKSSLYANNPESLLSHFFDFSAFFRIYPILKSTHSFSPAVGLSIITDSRLSLSDGEKQPPLAERVEQHFHEYLVRDSEKRAELKEQVLYFIEKYDQLYEVLKARFSSNSQQVAARAYVINEDRFYLFPVFSLDSIISGWSRRDSPYVIDRFIKTLIQASQRTPRKTKNGCYPVDMRVFEEGFAHFLLDEEGYFKVVFVLYKDKMTLESCSAADFHLDYKGIITAVEVHDSDTEIQIMSQDISLDKLAVNFTRDSVFLARFCQLFCKDKEVVLTDLYFPDVKVEYYLERLR